MKTRIIIGKLGVALGLSVAQTSLVAQTYDWLSWQYTNKTATARIAGAGDIAVTVGGTGQGLADMRLRFDKVTFTPTNAPAVGAQNYGGTWTIRVEMSALSATGGLLVGLGSFGHWTDGLPNYRLAAFDRSGGEMDLSSFAQIGSYDHTWLTPYSASFNDDVRLNVTNGNFEITTVPGLGNNDSDILLLSLPSGVGYLLISSLGPTGGDTVNVLAAIPHLGIGHSGSDAIVRWAAPDTNLVLEATSSLAPPSWTPVTNTPVLLNGTAWVTNPIAGDTRFFRLRLQ